MEIRSISSAAAFRVALTIFGVIIALRFVWVAYTVFIIAFLGILVGLALSRAVDGLERVGVKRAAGAPLAMLAVLAVLAAVGALGASSLRKQAAQLARELPRLVESTEKKIQRSPARVLVGGSSSPAGTQPGAGSGNAGAAKAPPARGPEVKPPEAKGPAGPAGGPQGGTAGAADGASKTPSAGQPTSGGLRDQLTKEMRGLTHLLFPIVSSVFGAMAGLVMVVFLAMYVAADPDLYRRGMLHLVPRRNRERATEVLNAVGDTLRRWLVARLIAMVVVGIVTGLALTALDIRGALALGVLSGLLEFVPFFGPIAGAVPAVGAAMLDSPQKALWVVILYVIVQQLEGSVLTPVLLKKRLDIPPVLTLVFVAALGVVFGILGMLIAEPILAVVLVATRMLYVEDVVGDQVASAEG